MRNILVYIFLLVFFVQTGLVWAKEADDSLSGTAKKITSSSPENPLIPHIEKNTKKNKDKSVKKSSEKDKSFPVFANEDLPKVSSLPDGKKRRSLTEEIKNVDDDVDDEDAGILKGTWVEKLVNSSSNLGNTDNDKGAENSLESLTENSGGEKKSNVSVFDVSGVMLRMTLQQTESALMKRGYKLVSQHYEIPNFIKWRYEEKCRDSGVVGYERLNSCVVKAAKEGNYQFVESAHFSKKDSKEEIVVWLTSNFTNNKVYKIAYETGITNINPGSGEKITYLRSVKIYEFWRRINQKYGNPDNKDDVLWGLGDNKPYMKAATGKLLLEDPMLRELDYTRMSREDQKFMNTNLYNF